MSRTLPVSTRPPGPTSPSVSPVRRVPVELAAARIVVVDDEPIVNRIVCRHLRDAGYLDPTAFDDPGRALDVILGGEADLVLTDLLMPGIGGLEILQSLVDSGRDDELPPVVVLSGATEQPTRLRALELGAADFLAKPVDPCELVARVRNVLQAKAHRDHLRDHAARLEAAVRARTEELEASRRDVIRCLARAAEFRDDETGQHILRVGRYTRAIAARMGFPAELLDDLEEAAQLHDVGKIGIPDAILLKPGILDGEEMEQMRRHVLFGSQILQQWAPEDFEGARRHTEIGAAILDLGHSPILKLAARIAMTHHERFDGTGYPHGLSGDQIPLEGRIVAVADVFDALSTSRPYKPAFPLDHCLSVLDAGRGTHFDPRVLDAFTSCLDTIRSIQLSFSDEH